MKKGIAIFVLLLLTICATPVLSQKNVSSRKEKAEKESALIKRIISSKDYLIEVNQASPLRGNTIHLTSNYSLKVKGDSIYSYLPYFGRAYNIPYGGGQGLIFNSTLSEYKVKFNKKGAAIIYFTTKSDDANIKIRITQFNNGSSNINVIPSNRESINFYGDLSMPEEKQD